jgi:hypothetical protein
VKVQECHRQESNCATPVESHEGGCHVFLEITMQRTVLNSA